MTAGFDQRPILVTGIPRSGTTWVGRLLCAGRSAGYLNEPFNLAKSPGTFRIPVGTWYPYITAANEDDFLPVLADAFRFRYPLARELAQCRNAGDVWHTLKWWRGFVVARGRRPLMKEPHAVFSARWFAERLGSDVVVTVRHPAAVVASWKRLEWNFDFANLLEQPALLRERLEPFAPAMQAALAPQTGLVERVALLWRIIYTLAADDGARYPAFRVVRHEDLSRDPLGGYAALYENLGLPFTEEAAAAVVASSSSDNPKETRAQSPYETSIDSSANLEQWRTRLDPEDVQRIRAITEETALRFYPNLAW
jgi:hypothetical protein